MSDRILTPLEQLIAESELEYEAHRDEVSADGAYHRLIRVANPNVLNRALQAEADRGVAYRDMMNATSMVIAKQILGVAASMRDPRMALTHLATLINFWISEAVSGRIREGVIQQDADGRQTEVTFEGLFGSPGGGRDE